MADGGRQEGFGFNLRPLVCALRAGEIVVDFFAGGGGASEALRQALGRDPDIAVNHDPDAIGMHAANHQFTKHFREDVYAVDIVRAVAGRLVGWFHASPDCTDHSQAKGGQPRSEATRSLSWAVIRVVGMLAKHGVAPRIISLENVRQILKWGPLIAKRDKTTGRVVKLDGSIAAVGERVPRQQQYLVPDPRHAGKTWERFVRSLESFGYTVETRLLRADDYGAITDRLRLYMIARRDGEPIQWPGPTHGEGRAYPKATAADCIDWTILGKSIFHRSRPLRPNTIRRLLDGAVRAHWPRPYIDALEALRDGRVPKLAITEAQAAEIAERLGHHAGLIMAVGGGGVARSVQGQVPTITRGGNGASPHFIRPIVVHRCNSTGGRHARSIDEPLPTIATRGAGFLAEPIIAPYYGSGSGRTGKPCSQSLPTATTKARFGLAEPVIVSTCNSSSAGVRVASQSLRTITTARGGDMAVAEPVLDDLAIDILYRMIVDRELYNAQGFPPDYIIDRTADGRRLTRAATTRMCGNSVSPPPLIAIARANLDAVTTARMAA